MSNTKSNRFPKVKKKRRLFFPKWEWYHDPREYTTTKWYDEVVGQDSEGDWKVVVKPGWKTTSSTNKTKFWGTFLGTLFVMPLLLSPLLMYLWFFIGGIRRTSSHPLTDMFVVVSLLTLFLITFILPGILRKYRFRQRLSQKGLLPTQQLNSRYNLSSGIEWFNLIGLSCARESISRFGITESEILGTFDTLERIDHRYGGNRYVHVHSDEVLLDHLLTESESIGVSKTVHNWYVDLLDTPISEVIRIYGMDHLTILERLKTERRIPDQLSPRDQMKYGLGLYYYTLVKYHKETKCWWLMSDHISPN
jgi:hypothetical protein